MPSKLPIAYPEANYQVTGCGDQNEPLQSRPQAQEVLPLCQ